MKSELQTVWLTTIDQHRGERNGTPVTELTEIITNADDIDGFADLDDEGKAEICGELAKLHAARVKLAHLDADERARAEAIIAGNICDEIAEEAQLIEDAIAEAEQATQWGENGDNYDIEAITVAGRRWKSDGSGDMKCGEDKLRNVAYCVYACENGKYIADYADGTGDSREQHADLETAKSAAEQLTRDAIAEGE